jgi:multiple sugar transport system substrate-binding protein
MGKFTKFQLIVLLIFVAGIIIGLATLSLVKGDVEENPVTAITIWGVWPELQFEEFVAKLNNNYNNQLSITYVQKDSGTFERELTENLALGMGPDAILVPQEMLLSFENKLLTVPYTTVSARDYKNVFIEQAELYLRDAGIIGIPFSIDPMVMYWNRDMFTNVGLATYPKIWDDFVSLTKKINQKDVNANIRKSAIALGEFANVTNARDIFSLILLQSGNPITVSRQATLGGNGALMTQNALNFFNSFSNPSSPAYSWNRSLPQSKNYFLAGNLATYFGYASELRDIQEKNPNLNFDIAPMPQPKNAKNRVNYGRLYGFSIVKSSANPMGTLGVLTQLTSAQSLNALTEMTYLPPVRRDLIEAGSKDPYLTIFYDAALISKGWLDPNPFATTRLFQNLAESVTSGRVVADEAIEEANNELNVLLGN